MSRLSIEELIKKIENKKELLNKYLEEKKAENERHKKNLKNINRKINNTKKNIKKWTDEKNKLEAVGLIEVLNEKGMRAEAVENAIKNNNTSAITEEIRAGEQRKAEEARKAAEKKKAEEEAKKTTVETVQETVEVAPEEKIEEKKVEEIAPNNKKRGLFGRK